MASLTPMPSKTTFPVSGHGNPQRALGRGGSRGASDRKRAATAPIANHEVRKVCNTKSHTPPKAHRVCMLTASLGPAQTLAAVLLAAGGAPDCVRRETSESRARNGWGITRMQSENTPIHSTFTCTHTWQCRSRLATVADVDAGSFWFGSDPSRLGWGVGGHTAHRTKPNRTAPHRTASRRDAIFSRCILFCARHPHPLAGGLLSR